MFSKIFKTEFVKNVKTFLIIMGVMFGISLISGLSGLVSYDEEGRTVGWISFACRMINALTYPIIMFGFTSLGYVLFGSFYRAVATDEFINAEWAPLPYQLLERAGSRIANEVAGVGRVVYDITSKPPATVEWE